MFENPICVEKDDSFFALLADLALIFIVEKHFEKMLSLKNDLLKTFFEINNFVVELVKFANFQTFKIITNHSILG